MKPGDVVYLKSGGPAMTVGHVEESVYPVCHWFSADLKIAVYRFHRDSLTTEKPAK